MSHTPKTDALYAASSKYIAELEKDRTRLNHLEELIRQCPHVEFYYSDDEANDKPLGFSITLQGCDTDVSVAPTFREVVDADMALTAKRNSE